MTGALIIGGLLIYRSGSREPPKQSVPDLIKQEEALNDRCRGGSGDNPTTQQVCDQRDELVTRLKQSGWCYGTEEQAEYQKQWQPCEVLQSRQRSTSQQSDEVHFDQNEANNRIMLSKMEAGTADCSNRLINGLLRQGMRSRSQILQTTVGICGQGITKFLEMQKVRPEAADQYARSIVAEVLDDVLRTQ